MADGLNSITLNWIENIIQFINIIFITNICQVINGHTVARLVLYGFQSALVYNVGEEAENILFNHHSSNKIAVPMKDDLTN